MPHTARERYSELVDAKLRATIVKRVGVICNNRYEGTPKAGAVSSTPSRALSEPAFPARQHLHLVAYWIIIWNRGRAIPAFLSSVLSACRLLWWMPFCLLR